MEKVVLKTYQNQGFLAPIPILKHGVAAQPRARRHEAPASGGPIGPYNVTRR